ncbi:hypothetical protein [Flavilitoribacter nigricans]|uniref:Uncharacterized protein n=1 Tax=Flavilitoribacter nigricans (strain ATCC 23147 / DSM 23189 / NBRC 102662 / NCIMB 1420 / SS-2) TaxID=1122177 RepID=A0A2D0N4W6_FLAN2|nr:hypothetical protein [Flavilitoribacter nigricans]PHN03477.1 hypothetical protein CRP01_26095 [Flavilitoribacter nigricans DSM 23189 = NBRC 102662]
MDKELENALQVFFDRLEKESGSLPPIEVRWNAGGDETPIWFTVNGKPVDYSANSMFRDLAGYLIFQFDLPNAGEYYNEGGGSIYRDDTGAIRMRYHEFAYGYDEDGDEDNFDQEILKEPLLIPDTETVGKLLNRLQKNELPFYGHLAYLKRKDRSLLIGYSSDAEDDNEAETETLLDLIEEHFRSSSTEELVHREIHFGGKINHTGILLDERSIIKYAVDKDHQDQDMLLFGKKP